MGNLAERDDDPEAGHLVDRSAEKLPACVDLRTNRLVGWPHAPNCIGDCGGVQSPWPVSICGAERTGKSVFFQRLKEKATRVITGERNAGAIGAAQPGRETDNQQLYGVCAFRWIPGLDRSIVPVGKFLAVLKDEAAQPRAEAAIVIRLVLHGVILSDAPLADQSSSKSSSSSAGVKARCGRSDGSRPISDFRLFRSIK